MENGRPDSFAERPFSIFHSPLPPVEEQCDHCASPDLHWVKCKLICRNCRQIVKSCADL